MEERLEGFFANEVSAILKKLGKNLIAFAGTLFQKWQCVSSDIQFFNWHDQLRSPSL